jgi:hypothetical protein
MFCLLLSGAANPGCSRLSGGFFAVRGFGFRQNRSLLIGQIVTPPKWLSTLEIPACLAALTRPEPRGEGRATGQEAYRTSNSRRRENHSLHNSALSPHLRASALSRNPARKLNVIILL